MRRSRTCDQGWRAWPGTSLRPPSHAAAQARAAIGRSGTKTGETRDLGKGGQEALRVPFSTQAPGLAVFASGTSKEFTSSATATAAPPAAWPCGLDKRLRAGSAFGVGAIPERRYGQSVSRLPFLWACVSAVVSLLPMRYVDNACLLAMWWRLCRCPSCLGDMVTMRVCWRCGGAFAGALPV